MARMNRPAPVEVTHKNMRFLITHNPTNATLGSFIEDLKKYGATTVVRVCEVTYDKAPLEKDGITVVWRKEPELQAQTGPARTPPLPLPSCDPRTTPVKCRLLAGLRVKRVQNLVTEPVASLPSSAAARMRVRAPVLVALALIESGMKYEDAIQFIRQKRRGAINSKQLMYLEKYRPRQRLRFKEPHTHKTKCCVM
ncbi:protein tyrosine phosphatase type IVA 3 [Pteropus alecto]|uniref:protein tyrosine phosphatase type IVA 3 n=1 Tax=Pteropus alecto TaxID=9402 RepID=UPI0003F0FECC|nr:protein tyrosine phosphatase type IVA 3 [Pteropus alecto]